MENNNIRIILANDHSLLLKGIRQALNKHTTHIQIVAEAENFQVLLLLLQEAEADILMTDDVMPGGTILEIVPLIKAQYPDLKIIVTSMYEPLNPKSIEVMDLVQGWVSYSSSVEEFIKAIEAVYASSTFYDSGK